MGIFFSVIGMRAQPGDTSLCPQIQIKSEQKTKSLQRVGSNNSPQAQGGLSSSQDGVARGRFGAGGNSSTALWLPPSTQVQQPKAQSPEPVDRCGMERGLESEWGGRSPGALTIPPFPEPRCGFTCSGNRSSVETGFLILQQMPLPREPVCAVLNDMSVCPGT